jgi:tetratricopeptide (TPR) repeat protein
MRKSFMINVASITKKIRLSKDFDSSSDSLHSSASEEEYYRKAKEFYLQGNYPQALLIFEKLNNIPHKADIEGRPGEILSFLSDLYARIGKESAKKNNYFAALAHFEKLRVLKEAKNDTKELNEVLGLIEAVYGAMANEFKLEGKFREAIIYLQQRKEIYKKLSKPSSEIDQELEQLYLHKAHDYYSKGNYKQALELFEKIRELYVEKDFSKGLLDIYSILGQLYFETSQVRVSLQYFTKLKDLADHKSDYLRKMQAFQNLGICYQIMKDYKTALNFFKMLLQLAWKENNTEKELIAYDYMSIQYFYLGDLEGARYYNNRVWKGITEKTTSAAREISNKALEAQKSKEQITKNTFVVRNQQGKKKKGSNGQNDDIEIGLPSPRTSSGIGDMQYMPVYPEKLLQTQNRRARSNSRFAVNVNKGLNKTLETKKSIDTYSYKVRPFVLLSHLSPTQSVKNFFYADQMSLHK